MTMRCIALLVPVLFFSACTAPEIPLPGITGKAGELVVVMDEKQWNGAAGDTVFNTLAQHVYGLPQPEPMFNVVHVRSSAFTRIFQTHRNLLIGNIGADLKPGIELKQDVWSTPQIVIEISAPTVEKFMELFDANANSIIGHVITKEQERILKSYRAQLNTEVTEQLETSFGLKLSVPKGYNIIKQEGDFCWMRYDTDELSQNLIVYSEPYTRANTFFKEGMIASADTFLNRYVPGPTDGTFMTTYVEYPPAFEETSIDGRFASKLIGLWTVKGALMGGPFVYYSFLDRSEKRVIHIYGFVFAPGKDKRNYLRQVEAVISGSGLMP